MATYFIDYSNGLDTNDGTLERPFKTPAPISDGGPHQLNAGDTVNFRGGRHDWSDWLSQNPNSWGLALNNLDATAAAPTTLQAYGSEKPTIVGREPGVANALIWVLGSEHVRILGLELAESYGWGALFVSDAAHIEIANNYIHDVDGKQDDNIAGIYVVGGVDVDIHHNLLHDNYDRERAATPGDVARQNSRNIVIWGDDSDRIRIRSNKVFNTPLPGGILTGAGIYIKHASEIPGASFEIHDNIVRDVYFTGIGGVTSNVYMHHNLLVDAAPYLILGGDNVQTKRLKVTGVRIENNTLVNSGTIQTHGLEDYNFPSSGFMTYQNNIVNNTPDYDQGVGILELSVYGSDAAYLAAVRPENLRFDRNVYNNPKRRPFGMSFRATAIWETFSILPSGRIWGWMQTPPSLIRS